MTLTTSKPSCCRWLPSRTRVPLSPIATKDFVMPLSRKRPRSASEPMTCTSSTGEAVASAPHEACNAITISARNKSIITLHVGQFPIMRMEGCCFQLANLGSFSQTGLVRVRTHWSNSCPRLEGGDLGFDHHTNHVPHGHLRLPVQLYQCFCRITATT